MRKLCTVLFLVITASIYGQDNEEKFLIETGTWNLEGSFSINSAKSEFFENDNLKSEFFGFSISPKVGYAIQDNLVIGLGLGYSYSESEFGNQQALNSDRNSNSYSIFPYIKKFIPIGKKMAFHLQGETRYSLGSTNFENSGIEERESKSFFIGIRPGVSYFLSKSILLQANFGQLGYENNQIKVGDTDDSETDVFGFDISSSNIIFGLTVLF
ncbi:porin family protein [Subsaximicrobium wynnwilliamsii]|uniref:Porin family protein n=1 Tax=Subsaximicrobium wynnwilliamsii TaxID=291179 RepID=A0A5C6ZF79_9FLAO|nr:outer membrane beta-barrel protein [Subsaximicrobium wynnwilliamsii]TXD82974.1 porin family protein [Subsaximicrobium wynnwilliamsii]TXD88696.1 porin family protein [Subsaximicrobium wynnwilliamsii]TXE02789.1 porin family protein [Subsaximicrobium wynnwilliamsii]